MPKKHRLSWMYEGPSASLASEAPEEDVLAVSPVEVAYPSDCLPESTLAEEPAAVEECEEPVPEAPPEEAVVEDPPAAEECEQPVPEPPTEEAVVNDPPAVEQYEEVACEAPAEEVPAEDYMYARAPSPLEEAPAIEEMPTECEREATQQANALGETKSNRSDEEATGKAEKLDDPAGEVVLICTSCTTMLLVEYDDSCPYSIVSSMCSEYESYSWLLHTTCFSCLKKHKNRRTSRDNFSDACMTAFAAAILSEELMTKTSWFEVADKVCRKPTRIVMDEMQRSVAYGKVDTLREETTSKCKVRGLKPLGAMDKDSGRTEIINSFVPGGFM